MSIIVTTDQENTNPNLFGTHPSLDRRSSINMSSCLVFCEPKTPINKISDSRRSTSSGILLRRRSKKSSFESYISTKPLTIYTETSDDLEDSKYLFSPVLPDHEEIGDDIDINYPKGFGKKGYVKNQVFLFQHLGPSKVQKSSPDKIGKIKPSRFILHHEPKKLFIEPGKKSKGVSSTSLGQDSIDHEFLDQEKKTSKLDPGKLGFLRRRSAFRSSFSNQFSPGFSSKISTIDHFLSPSIANSKNYLQQGNSSEFSFRSQIFIPSSLKKDSLKVSEFSDIVSDEKTFSHSPIRKLSLGCDNEQIQQDQKITDSSLRLEDLESENDSEFIGQELKPKDTIWRDYFEFKDEVDLTGAKIISQNPFKKKFSLSDLERKLLNLESQSSIYLKENLVTQNKYFSNQTFYSINPDKVNKNFDLDLSLKKEDKTKSSLKQESLTALTQDQIESLELDLFSEDESRTIAESDTEITDNSSTNSVRISINQNQFLKSLKKINSALEVKYKVEQKAEDELLDERSIFSDEEKEKLADSKLLDSLPLRDESIDLETKSFVKDGDSSSLDDNLQTDKSNDEIDPLSIEEVILHKIKIAWIKSKKIENIEDITKEDLDKISYYILMAKKTNGLSSNRSRENFKNSLKRLKKDNNLTNLSYREAFEFSKNFQKEMSESGIMTGNLSTKKELVGMRLKRIPDAIVRKLLDKDEENIEKEIPNGLVMSSNFFKVEEKKGFRRNEDYRSISEAIKSVYQMQI